MYLPPLPLLLLLLRLLRPLSPSDRALTPPGPDSQLAVEWSSHHLNRQPFAANSICTRTLLYVHFPSGGSPLLVRNAVAVNLTRSRMNVNHPDARLLRAQHHVVELWHPVFFPRKWVSRNPLQIMLVHQVLQGLGCSLLI